MDSLERVRELHPDESDVEEGPVSAARQLLLLEIEREEQALTARQALTTRRTRRGRSGARVRWTVGIATVVLVGGVVAGNVSLVARSAHAGEILRSAAEHTTSFADPVPGSGDYLLSRTHADWSWWSPTPDGSRVYLPNVQIIEIFKPADPNAEWVQRRDWVTGKPPAKERVVEIARALDGRFIDAPEAWIRYDYSDIPTDGAAAYEYLNAQYNGGSASRDENTFVRIVDMLRSGLVPAATRAALLDALSRVPGVTATENVPNLDGAVGTAIGRTESLRFGQRQEIIIDPATGLVIGERTLSTQAVFGYGVDDVIISTSIETMIVSGAP